MLTVVENDLELGDGRRLHFYDTLAEGGRVPALAVFWSHGSPNLGAPPAPLFPAAAELGIRFVSYDRPSYGGSDPQPGRTIASAASDVAAIADALGLESFALFGHSGGGPHVLGCAAQLGSRVRAVVSGSSLAPYDAAGLDYFAGLRPSSVAELSAAAKGRAALEHVLEESEFDPEVFTSADHAALSGSWAWLAGVAGAAFQQGLDGFIDDDLAAVAPWGFDLGDIRAPVLLVHGEEDRMVPVAHGRWLAEHVPTAELRTFEGDGHVSVLESAGRQALEWLREHAG